MKAFWSSHNGETSLTILQGDALECLRDMPGESVQTCITSPPYWGLRDYGVDGQLGLEDTPEQYVERMVEIYREVRRVLRGDGTCWLNLGDSYATGASGDNMKNASVQAMAGSVVLPGEGHRKDTGARKRKPAHQLSRGLKPKDLVGIPWLVAFALRADGWYLRSDVIWAKPNPMPESVTDRPTKAHEYIFLLTKRKRYFYDAEAVKEQGEIPAGTKGAKGSPERFNAPGVSSRPPEYKVYSGTRNRRTVWTVATQPYPGAHFATFPPKLIESMILAGASPKACPVCGAPWERVVERIPTGETQKMADGWATHEGGHGSFHREGREKGNPGQPVMATVTTGWQPTCTCPDNDGSARSVVLDPFMGSGTTLLVAQRLGRSGVGIELNPEYCEMAKWRLEAEHSQLRLGI